MDELTGRFLGAFNAIDDHLRQLCRVDKAPSFASVVNQCARSVSIVGRFKVDLIEYNELRNAIVHRFQPDAPIAIPSAQTTTRLEQMRDLLLSPPRVDAIMSKPVHSCTLEDKVGTAARNMLEKNLSQIPVCRDAEVVGLLTTDTIARWLAQRLATGIGLLEEEDVESVLSHQEDRRNCTFLSRHATAADALACFDRFHSQGHRLDAIIVTNSGKKRETPLGIVTIFDVRQLHSALVI